MQHFFVQSRRLILAIPIFISTCSLLSACSSTSTTPQDPSTQKPTPSDEESAEKSTEKQDDRGFNPCLINDQLAVCDENATSNSK